MQLGSSAQLEGNLAGLGGEDFGFPSLLFHPAEMLWVLSIPTVLALGGGAERNTWVHQLQPYRWLLAVVVVLFVA